MASEKRRRAATLAWTPAALAEPLLLTRAETDRARRGRARHTITGGGSTGDRAAELPMGVKALRRLARGVGLTPSSSKVGVPDAGGARFRYSGTCAYHAAAALPPDAWHDDSEAAWGTRPAHSGAQGSRERADSDGSPASVAEATFTIASLLVNYALVAMPYAFVQAGLAAVLGQALVLGLCTYTAGLLAASLEALVASGIPAPSYGDLAHAAIGPVGARLMALVASLECFFYCVGDTVIIADTARLAVPAPLAALMAASAALAVVQQLLSDAVYAYVSLVGSFAMVASLALVLTAGAGHPAGAHGMRWIGPRWPQACSLSVYCSAGHCCFPMVFAAVGDDRRKCMAALTNGLVAWFVVAVAFGLGGYYVYGSSARPDIMANVGRDADFEPVHLPVWIVAGLNLFILLKCQTVLVPTSRPIVAYVVDNPGRGGWRVAATAAPISFGIWLAALAACESLDVLFNLSCGVLMSTNAFVFPCFAYVRLCRPTGLSRAAAVAVGVGGGVFGAVLTATTLTSALGD